MGASVTSDLLGSPGADIAWRYLASIPSILSSLSYLWVISATTDNKVLILSFSIWIAKVLNSLGLTSS